MSSGRLPLYRSARFEKPINDPYDRFLIYYSLRNSKPGPGYGRSGLGTPTRVTQLYQDALAAAFDSLIAAGLEKPAAPIRVYLADPFDVTYQSSPGVFPEIDLETELQTFPMVLPVRTSLPTAEVEENFMRTLATHEITHSVCFSQPGFKRVLDRGSWVWLSEATAVWREFVAMAPNPPVEFLLRWCDRPEEPLIKDPDWYGAGVLVMYVAHRFGDDVIATLWRTGNREQDPWQELLRCTCPELFLDYCCDSYFYDQPLQSCQVLLPNVFDRLELRAWTLSIELAKSSATPPIQGEVRDFASRYYAVYVESGSERFAVDFVCKEGNPCARLFARAKTGAPTGASVQLAPTQTIETSGYPDVDHFVIAVASEPERTPTGDIPVHRFELALRLA